MTMENRSGKDSYCVEAHTKNPLPQESINFKNQKCRKGENHVTNSDHFCDRKPRTMRNEILSAIKTEAHFIVSVDYQIPLEQ